MRSEQLTQLEALRPLRLTVAATARAIGASRQGLHAYLKRHDGWPCPRCGREGGDGVIVTPPTCLRCELLGMLEQPDLPQLLPPPPRLCQDCGRETTGQRRYCQDCAQKRRRRTIHDIQRGQDRELAKTATNRYKAWRLEEDLLLLTPGLTLVEIARQLGRTRMACANRKRLLKEGKDGTRPGKLRDRGVHDPAAQAHPAGGGLQHQEVEHQRGREGPDAGDHRLPGLGGGGDPARG